MRAKSVKKSTERKYNVRGMVITKNFENGKLLAVLKLKKLVIFSLCIHEGDHIAPTLSTNVCLCVKSFSNVRSPTFVCVEWK